VPTIPAFLLKQMYVKGSLRAVDGGVEFVLHNHLATATIQALDLRIDGQQVPPESVEVALGGERINASQLSPHNPFSFVVNSDVTIRVAGWGLEPGPHELVISPETREIGPLSLTITDEVRA
jgi:hypothetical protein